MNKKDRFILINDLFHKFSAATSKIVGSPKAFIVAVLLIVVWAVSGPVFHYSDTWQLVINTGTTIITFLIVFLIQNTQNRDAKLIHLKLNELIRATHQARNAMTHLENLSDEELDHLEKQFEVIRHKRRRHGGKHPPA